MKYLIIIAITLMGLGCKAQNSVEKDSPLVTVIKLQAAESTMNLEEAEKYIDIEKVFNNYPDSKNPKEEWKEMLRFFYSIGQSKKFTNSFKYYNYNVSETINMSEATISFSAINQDAKIKEIVYKLIIVNKKWKVININYKN